MYGRPYDELDATERFEVDGMLQQAGDPELQLATKYEQYTLPGGENYREVVLAMPVQTPFDRSGWTVKSDPVPNWEELVERGYNPPKTGFRVYDRNGKLIASNFHPTERAALDEAKRIQTELSREKNNYTSSHFPDVPNYVAHMRLNERTDAEGNAGLFIEEIQSDRHQGGRKQGYKGEVDVVATIDKLTREQATRIIKLNERGNDTLEGDETVEELRDTVRYYLDEEGQDETGETFRFLKNLAGTDGVPDAPFRTTWPLAMFKRALRDAVESGKDWIGWTVGETQNDRFDLSKQVNGISVPTVNADGSRSVLIEPKEGTSFKMMVDQRGIVDGLQSANQFTGKSLDDVVGKDMADKIMALESPADFEGNDLKVGGSGMKGFYDNMLLNEIGKYVKQWGAKVEKSSVDAGFKESSDDDTMTSRPERVERSNYGFSLVLGNGDKWGAWSTIEAAEKGLKIWQDRFDARKGIPIWRIDITPEMRAGVERGQMLFSSPSRTAPVDLPDAIVAHDLGAATSRHEYAAAKAAIPLLRCNWLVLLSPTM
jgi:hypothetical protein